jgi:hypothetical protein
MRKQIYQFIQDLIMSMDGEPVKYVDLWNSQVEFIQEEQAVYFPAVFIEFPTINWRMQGGAVYEAAATVNLHIVTDSRVGRWKDVIEVFDLIDAITKRLHGQHTEGIDAVTRVSSQTDNRFGELMHNIETFSFHVLDTSARTEKQKITASVKFVI